MSRIGKRPATIPKNTEVTVVDGVLAVKGPKGSVQKTIHPYVTIVVTGDEVQVSPSNETRLAKALWGTYASHVKNMIQGVHTEFTKKLVLDGIGYRMAITGTQITLSVGFSHPVVLDIPHTVKATVEKNELTLSSVDKDVLGQFAANVRAKKKPEPYKGKGFHYSDEVIIRKDVKKAS